MNYRYYLIKNEINPNGHDSDEPLWLRDKDTDVYTHWVRFGVLNNDKTSEGLHYTVIVSDIDLKELDTVDCLEEISLEIAQSYNAILHPPREIEERIPNGYDEFEVGGVKIQQPKFLTIHLTRPTPNVEKDAEIRFAKGIYGHGTNHTGNIGTGTWALVDSPHHLTGNCTFTGDVTIAAGCTVIYDGNYSIIVTTGKIIAIGTTSAWIYFKSNSANQSNADYNVWVTFTASGAGNHLDYCDVQNCNYLINCGTSISAMTFSHLKLYDFNYGFNNSLGTAITINNSYIDQGFGTSFFINGMDFIFNDTEIVGNNIAWSYSGGAGTLFQTNRCYFTRIYHGNHYSSYWLATNCYFYNSNINSGSSPATRARHTFTTSIFNLSSMYLYGTDSRVMTSCDFKKSRPNSGGGAGVGDYITLSSISNCNNASPDNFDTTAAGNTSSTETPSQFVNVSNWDGGIPNLTMTVVPTGISASAVGDNQATINSTTTQYCKMRIAIGTVSGVYTDYFEFDISPTNLSGLETLFAKIHTNVIKNLKAGTKYYYALKGISYLGLEQSPLSAEGDFTTTSSTPVGTLSSLSKYNPVTTETITATVTWSNSPTWAELRIEKSGTIVKTIPMVTAGSGIFTCSINCMGTGVTNGGLWVSGIGVGTGLTVRYVARNASGISEVIDGSTLTVTAGDVSIGTIG